MFKNCYMGYPVLCSQFPTRTYSYMPSWTPIPPAVINLEPVDLSTKKSGKIILLPELPEPLGRIAINKPSKVRDAEQMLLALENLSIAFGAPIQCDWAVLCKQLLLQWPLLTMAELNNTRQNRHQISLLIQRKYNLASDMVDNYLCNYERTLPLH